jgi:hypothetical protein
VIAVAEPLLGGARLRHGLKDFAGESNFPQDTGSNATDLPSRVCQLPAQVDLSKTNTAGRTGVAIAQRLGRARHNSP